MMFTTRAFLLALCALLFIACGGDDGPSLIQGDSDSPPTDATSEDGTSADDTTASDGGPQLECWTGISLCEDGGVKTCVDGFWSEVQMCPNDACEDGVCTDCTPACDGVECGLDGCGGLCGTCPDNGACEEGICAACEPVCGDVACGDDGCGGQCGTCPDGQSCDGGACVEGCVPDCGDAVCGDDGCGGSCGFCDAGTACADGACSCVPDCAGKDCGDDGCGGQCGLCQGDFECGPQDACVPAAYRAVLIQDHWSSGCSNYNSSGADIDAVALYDEAGDLVSYFIEVIEEVGKDQCTNSYTDTAAAIGPNDNTDDGCIALQGGWIMGRFADYVPITSGMTLVVHEFGQQQGGSSEAFSVYLATSFDCAESDDPGACSLLISDEGFGPTEILVP